MSIKKLNEQKKKKRLFVSTSLLVHIPLFRYFMIATVIAIGINVKKNADPLIHNIRVAVSCTTCVLNRNFLVTTLFKDFSFFTFFSFFPSIICMFVCIYVIISCVFSVILVEIDLKNIF